MQQQESVLYICLPSNWYLTMRMKYLLIKQLMHLKHGTYIKHFYTRLNPSLPMIPNGLPKTNEIVCNNVHMTILFCLILSHENIVYN